MFAVAAIAAIGMIMNAFGAMEQGRAARLQGEQAKVHAEFEAREAEKSAGLAIAIGQRQAAEDKRQTALVASRALAVSAASGGGVSDPSIVNLLAKIQGQGAYRAHVSLYEGEARARQLRLQGAIGQIGGDEAAVRGLNAQAGYNLAGAGQLALGGASLYAKYGFGGPGSGAGAGAGSGDVPGIGTGGI